MERGGFRVRGLAEIVIRVRDLERMPAFYRDGLGLELWHRIGQDVVFFRIGAGFEGHTAILALVAEGQASAREGHTWSSHAPEGTTLHHFALNLPLEEYEAAQETLRALHIPFNIYTHTWIGYRSIYLQDPEGNVVELVCHDPAAVDPYAAARNAGGVRPPLPPGPRFC